MLLHALVAALTLGPVPPEASGGGDPSPALELRWSAPAGCPALEPVRDLVARLAPGTGAKLRAVARIDALPGGFVGTLELSEPAGGVRTLQADDCTVLARAMAVILAVSLDPVAAAASERRAGTVLPATDDAPKHHETAREPARAGMRRAERTAALAPGGRSVEAATAERLVPRSGRDGVEVGARLGAGVGGLLLPAAGVGLVLAPFLGTPRVHVRAVVQHWVPQTIAFDPARDAGGELQLVTAGVRVCPQLARGRARIPLCAGADAGAMLGRGTGRDLTTTRTARQPWAGAVLEPGVAIDATSRVSLWLALEGVVSLYRPRFGVDGAPAAWTAGAGAVRVLLGVEVHRRRDRPQNPR